MESNEIVSDDFTWQLKNSKEDLVEDNLDDVFGTFESNTTGQEFKDEVKKGWDWILTRILSN